MRIGIDARPLQHETQYRGIGKSLEFLLRSLNDYLEPNDSLVFYIDKGLPEPELLKDLPKSEHRLMPTARLGRRRYFRSFLNSFKPIDPSSSSIDVLLQYDAGFGVSRKVPCVVVFHDLIPYLFRNQEKQRPVKGFRKAKDALARTMYWNKYLRVLKTYKSAAKIIAISESSKKDLLKYVSGVKADDVIVVGHGLNQLEAAGEISTDIKRLSKSSYLLYVGGLDIRKNVMELLESFYELKPQFSDLKLVLVGKEFELKDRLEDLGWFKLLDTNSGFAKDVILPGFVTSAELACLYQNATAFVFPSRYEGFGLPVLEAMGAGCPVIAYSNSSIPEVAGDAALLVEDGRGLTPAIEKLISDPNLQKKLVTKGLEQAKRFSWEDTAQKILEVLRQAAKN